MYSNKESVAVEQDFDRRDQEKVNIKQPIFNVPATVIIFIVICCLVHTLRIYVLTPQEDFEVLLSGAFIPARYGPSHTFELSWLTSTVTYSFLHGSFSHLLSNCLWLAVFGSPLANTIGTLRFIVFWSACSMIAAMFHYYGQPTDVAPMIGASGAVAGLMGAAARFGLAINRQSGSNAFDKRFPPLASILRNKSVLTFIAVFLVTNLIIGSGQFEGLGVSIAWQAHIGGIVAGFVVIPLFLPAKSVH